MEQPRITFEIRDGEWATNLQEGLVSYMGGLFNSINEDTEEPQNTESRLPYCGCDTCEFREIMSFLAPRIIKGYLDKKIGFVDLSEVEV